MCSFASPAPYKADNALHPTKKVPVVTSAFKGLKVPVGGALSYAAVD